MGQTVCNCLAPQEQQKPFYEVPGPLLLKEMLALNITRWGMQMCTLAKSALVCYLECRDAYFLIALKIKISIHNCRANRMHFSTIPKSKVILLF